MLINRPEPLPYETLDSLLVRLRCANYAEDLKWSQLLLPTPHPRFNWLERDADYRAISELTGLGIREIWQLTVHRFAHRFDLPGSTRTASRTMAGPDLPLWNQQGIDLYCHGDNNHAECYQCTIEKGVQFTPWYLRHVTACTEHRQLLREPSHDHRALRRAGRHGDVSIADHPLGLALVTIIWSAIGCGEDFPPKSLSLDAGNPIFRMTSGMLLRFLWRLANLLPRRDPHNPAFGSRSILHGSRWTGLTRNLVQADVPTRHIALAAALHQLLDWPQTWYETLERIARIESRDPHRLPMFPHLLARDFHDATWAWLHADTAAFLEDGLDRRIRYPPPRQYGPDRADAGQGR